MQFKTRVRVCVSASVFTLVRTSAYFLHDCRGIINYIIMYVETTMTARLDKAIKSGCDIYKKKQQQQQTIDCCIQMRIECRICAIYYIMEHQTNTRIWSWLFVLYLIACNIVEQKAQRNSWAPSQAIDGRLGRDGIVEERIVDRPVLLGDQLDQLMRHAAT